MPSSASKIRTLAEAGVPLARIRDLRSANYDHAHDLDADDPRIDDLARRIAEATRERYGPDEPPELHADSEIPALIQGTVNASSPAWQRLDTLIRVAQRDA
ncbi:hypothetical protein [Streptomyces endocoffeicus]|uniref:hypothetical protein n=1 Tax=Streptomyces endocoffeicus TaxID=2898945 RepID=UPI001E581CB6|nr:hypothetical protein [Streptomyces endocoffeicus]